MRFITTLLAICLFLSHVRGQETATVCGKVTTSGGQPLPLANISLRGLPQGTTSDTTGYFCLNVPAGRDITLVVSSVGFTTLEYPIRLAPGETRAIHPEMKESTRELEEVTIAAEIRRTGSFVPVSIKDYRLIPNASGQFETLLKTLPGVSSRDELSSRYSVRGGNFDENLVYVNGVEIYRPFLIRSGQQEGFWILPTVPHRKPEVPPPSVFWVVRCIWRDWRQKRKFPGWRASGTKPTGICCSRSI